ncbi:hypothetical protein NUW54_g2056 [Trametes sanguinea]|uniref:Uncharacterized protein n=1 Tax=Trametes sanguinea TaxID=158606 RepID=A0ACC1Q4L3_9APHY|nr:hypothetical protein NUW54_g2056 [Trametes sanguinea]
MLADGSSTFDVADNTRIGQLALQQDRNAWISALGGSNDDAGWVVLALWKVGDYRINRGQDASPYYCLAQLPHDDALTPTVDRSISNIPPVNTSGSYWDDLVYIHMDLNTRIHSTGFFFPFHRFYVHAIETAMKERCGYTGAFPYWDWSIDAHDVEHSPLFEDLDPLSGLGGWGDPAQDIEVQTGGFRHLALAYPVPHGLRRNFTLQPFLPFASVPVFTRPAQYANVSFTPERVRALVGWTPGDFVGFQFAMEFPEVRGLAFTFGLVRWGGAMLNFAGGGW